MSDLTLKCRSGTELHVSSSKLLEASHSRVFREIIEKALAERSPLQEKSLLIVPDDDPDAWRICWALMNNAANLPSITKESFTATLRLASKYEMCWVLLECQDMVICSISGPNFWARRNLMSSFIQKTCSSLLQEILTNAHEDHDFEGCFQFLGLLSDTGLKSAYKMAISCVLKWHGEKLPKYLKQRVRVEGSLADCLEVSKDLATWSLLIAEGQKGCDFLP